MSKRILSIANMAGCFLLIMLGFIVLVGPAFWLGAAGVCVGLAWWREMTIREARKQAVEIAAAIACHSAIVLTFEDRQGKRSFASYSSLSERDMAIQTMMNLDGTEARN